MWFFLRRFPYISAKSCENVNSKKMFSKFFLTKNGSVWTTLTRKRRFACSRNHFRFSPDSGCFSDAIRESNPTLAGTTHNKDTDFLTKVRENNFVWALIMAVFQMQYAKATPRWPAPRTTRTQTSLLGEPIGQVAMQLYFPSDCFLFFLLKTWAWILTGVLQKVNLHI